MKLAVGLGLTVVMLAPGAEPDAGAAPAITRFYQTYAALKITGLPDSNGLAKLSPYLSAPLQKLLRTAKAEQSRCQKAHPDEKPPWIEGDLFSSNFEGFTKLQTVTAAGTIQGAQVFTRSASNTPSRG